MEMENMLIVVPHGSISRIFCVVSVIRKEKISRDDNIHKIAK